MTFKLFTELLTHQTDTVVSEIDGAEPDVPHLLDCFDSMLPEPDFFKYFTNVSAACRMLTISEASHCSCVSSRAWHSMMLNRRTAVKSSVWSDGKRYVWALICDQHHFILAHFCHFIFVVWYISYSHSFSSCGKTAVVYTMLISLKACVAKWHVTVM